MCRPGVVRLVALLAFGVAALAPGAPARAETFSEFKARMISLFRSNSYLNLATVGRHHGGGINPALEGAGPWSIIVREVEKAEQGPGMAGAAAEAGAVMIAFLGPSGGQRQEVWYLGGMVGPEDSSMSLKVRPAFGQAVEQLIAIAQRTEAEFRARPENPESWPVKPEQAMAIARALAEAAGSPSGRDGASLNSNPRPRRQHTVTLAGSTQVILDGADGSILAAKSLAPPQSLSALSREQALARGRAIAAAMGVKGEPSLEKRAQEWALTWKGSGTERATVRLDARTGALVSASESLKGVHPRIPTMAELAPPAPAEVPPPPSLRPAPGTVRITDEQAKQIVAAFAKRERLPFGEDATVSYLDPNTNYLKPPAWQVRFHSFGEYEVDANSGAVIHWATLSAAEAEGERRLDEAGARAAGEKALRALGLPADAVFGEARCASHGEGLPEQWTVRWNRRTPQGVLFEDDGAFALLNAATGQVWSASLRWSSRLPDNTRVEIAKDQAVDLARKAAEQRPGVAVEPAGEPELKVVHPNGYWSASPVRWTRYDAPTRTAWIVNLTRKGPMGEGRLIYWVDATDGAVLGGTQSMGGGPLTAGSAAAALRGRRHRPGGGLEPDAPGDARAGLPVAAWVIGIGAVLLIAAAAVLVRCRRVKGAVKGAEPPA